MFIIVISLFCDVISLFCDVIINRCFWVVLEPVSVSSFTRAGAFNQINAQCAYTEMSGPGVIVVREAERPEPEGEPVRVHCVPCAVEGGGGADVEGRFEPTVRSKGEGGKAETSNG